MTQISRLFADLSSNNSHFDAGTYRDAGHVIVAIKATEGTGFVNPNHRAWSLHAGMHHIAVIHYHFARPDAGNSPDEEARHFLSVALPLTGGRDYLVLDLERATPQGWSHDPQWSRGFDAHVRSHSRFRTILYANRSTLQQSDQWLPNDPKRVWDADFSTAPDFAPAGYVYSMRQFTDGVFGPEPHSLPGVGVCDVSRASFTIMHEVTRQMPHRPCS